MLILASASQSRKKLLENCQIEFIQISSDFDETTIQEKNIFNLALELSFQKANSLSENIQNISLPEEFNYGPLEILGCDSIFEFKGEAYGKPSNKEEAFIRWKKMSGIIKKTVSSRVYFSNLEDWEIKSYVDTNEPLYCAGGFALEGIGGKYIEKIEGCFSNVMGLSLPWLRDNLNR